MTFSITPPNEDPYFFDREDLQSIADDRTINQGLRYFKDNRVMEIDQDVVMLWGTVEDDDFNFPLLVHLKMMEDGSLSFNCDCGLESGKPCVHQVATLYAYADKRGETDDLISAADRAIKDRVKRGRSEVRVESMSGEPWFGTWHATSLSSASHFSRSYGVTIRSLKRLLRLKNAKRPESSLGNS